HRLPDGVALARRRRRGPLLRHRRQLGGLLVVVLAADRVLELPHSLPDRAAHLGQALRAEDEEDHDQEDHELPGANPTGHASSVPPNSPTAYPRPQVSRETAVG